MFAAKRLFSIFSCQLLSIWVVPLSNLEGSTAALRILWRRTNKEHFWLNATHDIRIFSLSICISFPPHRTTWSITVIHPDYIRIFNFWDGAWSIWVYGGVPEIKGAIRDDDVVLLIECIRYHFPLVVVGFSHLFYECIELYVAGITSCLLSPYCFSTRSSLVIALLLYFARFFGF